MFEIDKMQETAICQVVSWTLAYSMRRDEGKKKKDPGISGLNEQTNIEARLHRD